MKSIHRSILPLLIACVAVMLPTSALSHPHIIDAAEKIEISKSELLNDLRQAQVIFMGEFHDHTGHHQAQLAVIKALADDDRPLAIGLEMFRSDSQQALDRWTADELPVETFLTTYYDNWSMWPEYRDIFLYSKNENLKMLGLNIPRSITSKVASEGFDSLSDEERQMLGNVQCQVSPDYSDFIRQAMGGHGGHGDRYVYFCEAQLLWDTMMARNLVDFLKDNPDYRVVVLAGSGHAWKFGIPQQMLKDADLSYRVVLPEDAVRVNRVNVNQEITDYLWLDVGKEGWGF